MWWQILISLLSGLCGTALGGYISYRTMLAQMNNQREIEKEQRIQRRREELYIQILDVLMEYNMRVQNLLNKEEVLIRINKLQSQVGLYTSKQVFSKYYKLLNAIQEKKDKEAIRLQIVALTKIIKKELGIQYV